MPEWGQIHVASDAPQSIEDALLDHGAVSVTLSDAADNPVLEPAPGEVRLWPKTIVSGLFEDDADLAGIGAALVAAGLCTPDHLRHEILKDRAWEREWLADFGPMQFGRRLWVSPHEAEAVWPADAVVLRMDPGLAFGTGTHPTTRLCLQWLDEHALAGKHVIDFGCGSGVLAVAAALLGAEHVRAYDIDPQALTATAENARANGVLDRIQILPVDEAPRAPADIVLANILAGTLIDLAEPLRNLVRPEGHLVMSGILAEQAQSVSDAYIGDFLLTPENSEAWVRIDGRRFAQDA